MRKVKFESLFSAIVCDEGSSLVRLFHQIIADNEDDNEAIKRSVELYNNEIENEY